MSEARTERTAGRGDEPDRERAGATADDVAAFPGGSARPVRRVAVTTLAEFACRVGDLDPTGVVGPSAREGMLAHRRVQRARTEGSGGRAVETEVRLARRVDIDGEWLELAGRVDLLERGRDALGEIKSTLVPPGRVPPARLTLHRAQLMLYGWLYLGERGAGDAPLELELLYVNLRAGGQPEVLGRTVSVAELERHALDALRHWLRWQLGVERRARTLAASARALRFPHRVFREGQRAMSVAVYRCLRDGGTLLCEAPTGIGKTVSSLFPAVKALGEGHRRQVLYLTAKVSGRQSAMDALARLSDAGLRLPALLLRSRADACFCERGRCERDARGRCPMTLGFFDRLPDARAELVEVGLVTAERLDRTARAHRLCPHALAAELLPWMGVVVGDYNHVFDPLVRLGGFEQALPHAVLLVDEAHNLPERARAMHSAALLRSDCTRTARACADTHPLVARRLEGLGGALLRLARGIGREARVADTPPSTLSRAVSEALGAMAETSGEAPALPAEATELQRALLRYALVDELYGEEHRTLIEGSSVGRRREVRVRLASLDASTALARRYRAFGASALFSATLSPPSFYRAALGLPEDGATLALRSPFDAARALHVVAPWVDTRYRRREGSLEALVRLIRLVSESRAGNHLVFLPSYAYLERVHAAFSLACPERETWRQTPGQDAAARGRILERLGSAGHRVGFAILGGVYGEGVDYVGERLIGVVVVGTGLPGLDAEHALVAERHRARGLDGFDHAARYPGFTRVLQTVGRVIRDERDRGVVVLVDPRFEEPFYRRLFPEHWNAHHPSDEAELGRLLERFWRTDG